MTFSLAKLKVLCLLCRLLLGLLVIYAQYQGDTCHYSQHTCCFILSVIIPSAITLRAVMPNGIILSVVSLSARRHYYETYLSPSLTSHQNKLECLFLSVLRTNLEFTFKGKSLPKQLSDSLRRNILNYTRMACLEQTLQLILPHCMRQRKKFKSTSARA